MMDYSIQRPPLHKNFALPTREELLILEKGDSAKVIFQVGDESPERMWVLIDDCSDDMEWTGTVDNDAVGELTAKTLPAGTKVKFHPLDIIALQKND
jgi:hypothetical protein